MVRGGTPQIRSCAARPPTARRARKRTTEQGVLTRPQMAIARERGRLGQLPVYRTRMHRNCRSRLEK
eukprot:2110864-Alexandrium_andersonii.AAC.1